MMSEDAKWPRAANWLVAGNSTADIGVFGVGAHKTSISKTSAHKTPAAIRKALLRYSTFNQTRRVDIRSLTATDFGDVRSPDSTEGEARTSALAAEVAAKTGLTMALGGDNSITFAVARGVFGNNLSNAGLITLDAHHDLRDGISNGSPVRRLIDAGLDPKRIVQIGIADFSNSPKYAELAQDLGIHVIARSELRKRSIEDIWAEAVLVAGAGGAGIHVDFDMDVCDRSVVPGCPAAAPGGISADEMRQFAYLAGWSSLVKSLDITEIDAAADAADGRTVRLAALVMLEAAAGFATR
jgi:arginase family enzyme